MIEIPAKRVYIDPRVYERRNCRERLERVLPNIRCDDVRELAPGDLQEVMAIGKRRHGKDAFGADAVLVFTDTVPDRDRWYYHWRDEAGAHGGVCQPGMELNVVDGCPFRCAYCGFGRYIVFSLDVERLVDGLDDVFARHPEQRLYKYSNMTDLPPFEPELDAIPPMIERFAREPDRYVMLFTKSDNVDFLRALDHRGHTIISWSLSGDSVSRTVDAWTPPLDDRIEAMAAMQATGYLVRARLSPIVPVANWREEYAALFEHLFARVRPDVVTLELLGWMPYDDLVQIVDPSALDPGLLGEAELAREGMAGIMWGPFTQRAHEEVYAFCIERVRELSPGTPVSVCHGTADTWQALGGKMQMAPEAYVCNCGPMSAPGGAVYDRWHGIGRGDR